MMPQSPEEQQRTPVNSSQTNIIANVNNFMKLHNYAYLLNEKGVCHGLSTVYAKYALLNKENEFQEMLRYLSTKRSILNDKAHQFILDVIVTQNNEFSVTLDQAHSYKSLSIDDKPLRTAYELHLNAFFQDWLDVFKEIDLHPDEVMLLSGLNHTIAVRKINDKYILFDPNTGHEVVCEDEDHFLSRIYFALRPRFRERIF